MSSGKGSVDEMSKCHGVNVAPHHPGIIPSLVDGKDGVDVHPTSPEFHYDTTAPQVLESDDLISISPSGMNASEKIKIGDFAKPPAQDGSDNHDKVESGSGSHGALNRDFVFETPPRPTKRPFHSPMNDDENCQKAGDNTPSSHGHKKKSPKSFDEYSSETSCASKRSVQEKLLGKSGYHPKRSNDSDSDSMVTPNCSWRRFLSSGKDGDSDAPKTPTAKELTQVPVHSFFKTRRTD